MAVTACTPAQVSHLDPLRAAAPPGRPRQLPFQPFAGSGCSPSGSPPGRFSSGGGPRISRNCERNACFLQYVNDGPVEELRLRPSTETRCFDVALHDTVYEERHSERSQESDSFNGPTVSTFPIASTSHLS